MKFISARDLRLKSGEVWKKLKSEGDLVVTSNGKPVAVLSDVGEENLEMQLKALRRARAELAVNEIQQRSSEKGLDNINPEEIEAEIKAAREKRSR